MHAPRSTIALQSKYNKKSASRSFLTSTSLPSSALSASPTHHHHLSVPQVMPPLHSLTTRQRATTTLLNFHLSFTLHFVSQELLYSISTLASSPLLLISFLISATFIGVVTVKVQAFATAEKRMDPMGHLCLSGLAVGLSFVARMIMRFEWR